MPEIAVVIFISLLVAIFVRPWWLGLLIDFVGLAIILGMVFIGIGNNGEIDLTAFSCCSARGCGAK